MNEYSVGKVKYIIENLHEIKDSIQVGGEDMHLSYMDVRNALESDVLNDKHKEFVKYWSNGYEWYELTEMCGLSKSTVYRWQEGIAKDICNYLNKE